MSAAGLRRQFIRLYEQDIHAQQASAITAIPEHGQARNAATAAQVQELPGKHATYTALVTPDYHVLGADARMPAQELPVLAQLLNA